MDPTLVEIEKRASSVLTQNALMVLRRFLDWLALNGYSSYDQYDFWASKFGVFAKKTYYVNHLLGAPLVAPLIFLDAFLPESRKLFAKPKRFPIADAHFIMGFLNLYDITGESKYLEEAKSIANDLLKSSIPGHSGHCWGYPFDWQTNRGLWKRGIPFITTTPYCFEAFLSLYDVTGEQFFLDVAYSSLRFALHDFNETVYREDMAACSYSPVDTSKVVNGNAYRSFMLLEGYRRFGDEEAKRKAIRNLNFVLANQREDGSWLYAIENPQDAFVDNFHTCFVLKNLYKANIVLQDERVAGSIWKGYRYYAGNLFYKDGTPRPFAEIGRFALAKVELYDFAEGITLGLLLKDDVESAIKTSHDLVKKLLYYQTEKGYFVTRVSPFGKKNRVPYLRWPQSQLFYALTQYLKVLSKERCVE